MAGTAQSPCVRGKRVKARSKLGWSDRPYWHHCIGEDKNNLPRDSVLKLLLGQEKVGAITESYRVFPRVVSMSFTLPGPLKGCKPSRQQCHKTSHGGNHSSELCSSPYFFKGAKIPCIHPQTPHKMSLFAILQ